MKRKNIIPRIWHSMNRSRLWILAGLLVLITATLFTVAADTSPRQTWKKLTALFVAYPAPVTVTAQSTVIQHNFQLPSGEVARMVAGALREATGVSASSSPAIMTLPYPDGKSKRFRLLESPLLTPEMTQKYSDIKSYTAQGMDDPEATARFSWTSRGLHGAIVGSNYTVFIHPLDHRTTSNYVSYFAPQDSRFECKVTDKETIRVGKTATAGVNTKNGGTLRTYRMALASPAEYTLDPTLGGGTVASTVASFNVWLNQINAVYERELSIRFTLVNNTSIIYTDAVTDPFSNPTDPSPSLTEVRDLLRTQVGVANYDLGHVLLVGDTGGVAYLGVTCDGSGSANKGGGVSGVPAPLGYAFGSSRIMHETAHQFGATHTFNDIASCSSNRSPETAYESGNGMTILAYPVQCSTPIVPNRELRFHAGSLAQIVNYLSTTGGTCPVTSSTGNNTPTVSGGQDRTVPRNTPFTLTASGSDPDVNDSASLTYVWEQIDAGGASYGQDTTTASFTDAGDPSTTTRPIFRPFPPSSNPSRTFPSLTYILNNANVPPGIVSGYYTAENLPNVSRSLNFRVTLRDNRAGGGAFSDDHVILTVDGNSGPFQVTSPNTAVSLPTGSMQTVTWNVNNTNLAPVNCVNVKISLSTDGGNSFPYVLAESTANDGSETITLPNLMATVTTARIKVEAVGNVFFDISDASFTISSGTSCPVVTNFAPGAGNTGTSVKIYGTGFTGATTVKFSNNVSASFTVNSDNQITVTQPAGAVSGPITISKSGCADTLTANYIVCSTLASTLSVDDSGLEQIVAGRYLVNRLTPVSYPATLQSISVRIASTQYLQVGTPFVLLAGVNTDGDTDVNNTSFQTTNVTVTAVNSFVKYDLAQPITINSGDFVVGYLFPNGGASAGLDTSSPDSRSYSSDDGLNFTLNTSADYFIRAGYLTGCGLGVTTCPTISGINPSSGQIGDSVTIAGAGFSGASSLKFNNNVVANFTVVSDTQITTTVPARATTGAITISKPGCSDALSTSFTVNAPACPTVSGFSPLAGQPGNAVIITGTNLTGVGIVKFAGDVAASFTVDSPTQITAIVPNGANYGPITLSKQGCADVQTTNFIPCNSPFTLQVDDGTIEASAGTTALRYYVNRLTPLVYPATLTTIQLRFQSSQNLPEGTALTLRIGVNPTGSTNINGISLTGQSATVGTLGQFNNYTLTTPVTINSGDFVIGFSITAPSGAGAEGLDTSSLQGRSYKSTDGGATFGVPTGGTGNYLIRGQYNRPCCTTLAISAQPTNQTVCPASPTTFSVTAAGTGLTYQWRKGGANISGANSSSYMIASATVGDVGNYDVVVSDSCGSSLTSDTVALALNSSTMISSQPTNQTACPGTMATFSVGATGTGLSYQWRKGGMPISGANLNTYSISSVAAGDAGSYDVVVTGLCGAVTSNTATLAVNVGTSISTQPTNQAVCEGSMTTFSVAATGSGLSYQWRKGGMSISGANSANYSIASVAATDAGSYDVVVTGTCGTLTSNAATLTVDAATVISTQPMSQTVCENAPASFSVAATGIGLSYQWRKGGINISGANSATFNIASATIADAGSYDVVVTGTCGTLTSDAVTLIVKATTGISTQPTNQTACANGSATFSVVATGSGLSYQWRKGGANISGANSATFNIASVSAIDAGSYDVVVTGTCGTLTSNAATLTVNAAATISTQPMSQTICENAPASFSVAATGTGLSYQWRKGGINISGANSATFNIASATIADAGSYDVVVTGTCGTLTSDAVMLTVNVCLPNNNLQFYPLAHPVRLLDTRAGFTGCDAPGAKIPGGTSRMQTVAGRTCDGLTIPANARAVTGNITTVQSGGGWLTLYPSDVTRPLVANSNYTPNQILNNVFTVGVGTGDGAFNIYVTSNTDVVVDVTGYYAPPTANGLYFHPLPKPVRLLETRSGFTGCFAPAAPLSAGSTTTQIATTTCDGVVIPAGAQALVGNATTVNLQSSGWITLYPADVTKPLAASSNFQTGDIMNAPFTVGLSPSGQFNIFTTSATDLVVDVTGYYSTQLNDVNGQGLLFNSLPTPVRLLDTRAGFTGCFTPGVPMQGGSVYSQSATGICSTVPAEARAVVGNATVVNVTGDGYMTFWPGNVSQPYVAMSNFTSGQIFNRHFTVGLGEDRTFKRFVTKTTDLVLDLSGYFAP